MVYASSDGGGLTIVAVEEDYLHMFGVLRSQFAQNLSTAVFAAVVHKGNIPWDIEWNHRGLNFLPKER